MKQVNAHKQSKRQQEDAILDAILIWIGCAVVVELVLLLINRFFPGIAPIQWLSILVPAAAVLALVYYLYQRDFFLIALISAGGIFSLQLYRKMALFHPFRIKMGFVLAFVCLAAAVILLILLQRQGGQVLRSGKPIRVLPKDTNYPLLYATCALNAVLLGVTLGMGGTTAYYLMFVLVAWLFIMAVYFTVRLI